MDCYYGSDVSDFLVPKDEVLLDRYSSPDYWSRWGQTALSCDQPKYQLQDLPRFERMNDIFLDTIPEDASCVEFQDKCDSISPEKRCSYTPGGSHKDSAASKFVSFNSESKDCMEIEAPPVKVLDSSEQCGGDDGVYGQFSHEEFILKDLQMVIGQFTEGTRVGFRDALYRLSGNNEQQQVLQGQDAEPNAQKAMLHTDYSETVRFENNKSTESETNSFDRLIAKLMFNNMEFNMNGHQ